MKSRIVVRLIAGIMLITGVSAADTIVLSLTANGTSIKGDKDGAIECTVFEQFVEVAAASGTAQATGRRKYAPIKCTKRVDKSSPLLLKALTNNEVVTGTFKFLRRDGDKPYYTIAISQGRVLGVKTLNKSAPAQGTFEEVSIVFTTITWSYGEGAPEHTDTWTSN